MSHEDRPHPVVQIRVDAAAAQGPLELWRSSLGHGGINAVPLPDRVVEGVRRLGPRLIRIFIQEFFSVYPQQGRFDWSRLDPYMDALARAGAKVMAALTIKPKPLYPSVDQAVWRPSDVGEWQRVVGEMVRRYSVEQKIVTHWEIGNEPDIGEDGGCPYLIRDPEAYGEYYAMTIEPILRAFPQAKVGGPAMAVMHHEPLPGFLKYCRRTGVRLDFVSWHLYHSDPGRHAFLVEVADLLCKELLGRRPEFFVTEWNRRLGGSTEDAAFDARRAAAVAAAILDMRNAGLDGSFYYHIWDQMYFPSDFEPFFSSRGVTNMIRHWNETPHRLGLFGVNGEVRPQYFIYWMLRQMGEDRLAATCDDRDVRVVAGRSGSAVCALAVNYSLERGAHRAASVRFCNIAAGPKRLTVYRVDAQRRWCPESLELQPIEQRDTYAGGELLCQVLLPADSVALIRLSDGGPGRQAG
jgi:hypothetical protein